MAIIEYFHAITWTNNFMSSANGERLACLITGFALFTKMEHSNGKMWPSRGTPEEIVVISEITP